MCVNDLVVQGAEPLFFLDYYATASSISTSARDRARHRRRLPRGGLRADRRRDRGNAGHVSDGDYDLAGFAVGAAERGKMLPRDDIAEGDVAVRPPLLRRAFQRLFARAQASLRVTASRWDAPAPFDGEQSRSPKRC